jgi:hypothetical protein
MPSSTLLQLVARGRQDIYLTGSPQFTFFKHVYRRYTPFAIESIPIEFDGTPDFGRRISAIIPRKADLLSALYLEVDLPIIPPNNYVAPPITYYWTNDIAHALIEDISIEIGDKEIDKQTGEWLQVWSLLSTPAEKRAGLDEMIGHWNVYPPAGNPTALRLAIPLRFWFCNSIGAALPLIALQAHPVRIIIHLRKFQDLWWSIEVPPPPGFPCPTTQPVAPTRIQLYGDYVFLDKEERQRFAASEHEYLITQVQYTPRQSVPMNVSTANIPLVFNHCCKEFIWLVQQDRMAGAREWFNYSNALRSNGGELGKVSADLLDSAILRLDGYERFQRRNAQYFRMTQPYQYHTNIPDEYVYLYSFSLRPEEEQPAGSINCSKFDDIQLGLAFNPAELTKDRVVTVYTMNYNILRIIGGLGGLAFIT